MLPFQSLQIGEVVTTCSIIIKNSGTTPIKNWKLEFDYNGNLTQVWDSKISSKINNHYVITNAG